MKINEVERLVGITKKNIRFYEEQGLLNPDRNRENGYRDYSEEDVQTLEQKGAAFQNKQKYDMRLSYVAPVLISVLMVLLMAGFMVMMAWTAKFDPDEAPPLAFTVIMMTIPLAVIGGVIYALLQRIGEIKKGEMDDARKY